MVTLVAIRIATAMAFTSAVQINTFDAKTIATPAAIACGGYEKRSDEGEKDGQPAAHARGLAKARNRPYLDVRKENGPKVAHEAV